MDVARTVRPPAVAGMFYPAHPRTLRRDVEGMLEAASGIPRRSTGAILGAVVPHAGYPYSGRTAAAAYQALKEVDFETAVFVGPSHRESFRGSSVFSGGAYATPLGEVGVDLELAARLASAGGSVSASMAGHRQEHAIEVQLPFLQVIKPKARMVAITMGGQGQESCRDLASALSDVMRDRSIVLLASSDLSHYHPYDEALRLDKTVEELIRTFQPERLQDELLQDRVEACGGGPIVTVMMATRANGAGTATILHVCNSGDVTGDHSGVVGYLSAIFTTS
jgi:AmmeMemoRadiSam system protein B